MPKQLVLQDQKLGLTLTLTVNRAKATARGILMPGQTSLRGVLSPEGMTMRLENGTTLVGTFRDVSAFHGGYATYSGFMLVDDNTRVLNVFDFRSAGAPAARTLDLPSGETGQTSQTSSSQMKTPQGRTHTTMKPAQRRVLLIGAIVFTVVTMFPPWEGSLTGGTGRSRSLGYGFIGEPPRYFNVRIDLNRLFVQWVLIVAVTAVAYAVTRDRDV